MSSLLKDAQQYLPELFLKGFQVALPLTLISFLIGLILAVLSAVVLTYPVSKKSNFSQDVLKTFVRFYIWLFRSTPLIVQLYIAFYGLPQIFGDAWIAAIIILSLNVGAYGAESVRGAIISVPKIQFETGLSNGLSNAQVYWHIVLPQAAPVAIPPLSNSFISLFKDTALVSTITIVEPFLFAQQVGAEKFHTFNMLILAAIMYAVFTTFLGIIQRIIENKLAYLSPSNN